MAVPVASAGGDKRIWALSSTAGDWTLDASGSTGGSLTYQWLQTAGSVPLLLSDPNIVNPVISGFPLSLIASCPMTFTFQVTTTNVDGSDTDEVVITIDSSTVVNITSSTADSQKRASNTYPISSGAGYNLEVNPGGFLGGDDEVQENVKPQHDYYNEVGQLNIRAGFDANGNYSKEVGLSDTFYGLATTQIIDCLPTSGSLTLVSSTKYYNSGSGWVSNSGQIAIAAQGSGYRTTFSCATGSLSRVELVLADADGCRTTVRMEIDNRLLQSNLVDVDGNTIWNLSSR